MVIYKSELHFRYNLFDKTSYEWRWQFSHYSNIKMEYHYCSNITFIMFWAEIARFLQYFRNLSNSSTNILAILQDFNGIFLKYSLNITVLCGLFLHAFFVSQAHFDNGILHIVTHNFHLKIRSILELTTCPVKFGTTCPSVIFLRATGSWPPCLRYVCCWLAHVFGKRTPFKII